MSQMKMQIKRDIQRAAVFCILGFVATFPHQRSLDISGMDWMLVDSTTQLSFCILSAIVGILIAPFLLEVLSGTASEMIDAYDETWPNDSVFAGIVPNATALAGLSLAPTFKADFSRPPAVKPVSFPALHDTGAAAMDQPPENNVGELMAEEEDEKLEYLVLFRSRLPPRAHHSPSKLHRAASGAAIHDRPKTTESIPSFAAL